MQPPQFNWFHITTLFWLCVLLLIDWQIALVVSGLLIGMWLILWIDTLLVIWRARRSHERKK